MNANWERIRKHFLNDLLDNEALLESDTDGAVKAIVAKLRGNGWEIDSDTEAALGEFAKEMRGKIKGMIEATADMIAVDLGLAGNMRDGFTASLVKAVFEERYPDGLTLDPRLWKWSQKTTQGLRDILRDGLRAGKSANQLMYEMQFLIEKNAGEKFALVMKKEIPDWLRGLDELGRIMIRTKGGREIWALMKADVTNYINGLSRNGTFYASSEALKRIERAIRLGREDLIQEAIKRWLYDKQLYNLKRITRTETSTALHKAQIIMGNEDPDVIGFQWRLSASHPKLDICDFYASVEFGLGRGVWPKDRVPQRKAHPQ